MRREGMGRRGLQRYQLPRLVLGGEKQGMDNPLPSLAGSTDFGAIEIGKRKTEEMNQVKTGESSSKLVGEKRRNLELEAKIILKQWKKVKSVAEKVAHMRAEASSLKAETAETVAAADEKEKEVKFEKEKRDGCLAAMLLMSGTEHVLMDALFPPSGNC